MPAFTPREELSTFLDHFIGVPSGPLVTEVRALRVPSDGARVTLAGFFDLAADAGRAALEESVAMLLDVDAEYQPEGVYLTMNPLRPDVLARSANSLRVAQKKDCVSDADVLERRWVVVDVDPVRPARVSATHAEKTAAWRVVEDVRADLDGRGWPRPLLCDSGNGFHLWYPVAGPSADCGRTERVLKGLAQRHGSTAAKIDATMYNPSRIAKLCGTWARKGISTAERPHRLSRVLEVQPL